VLNRLISAQDQTHWANTYSYDAWGNMQKIPVLNVPGESLQVAGDANNHMLNYTYDAAGNMQSDGTYRYTFDAENRIACMNPDVNWVCHTNSISYTYDADGRRVKKSSGANYWYGPGGAAYAETDSAGNWTNYIFFGGQRLARNVSGDIKYYITDHLHSTAMFVDKAGTTAAILDDNDMYPWGGIVPGVGKTTSTNTVKFTGKYRDNESQLDYFGARYYSNTIGRFMSPDWAAKPTTVPYAKFGDPQSLNLYSYVENGPVNRIDVDGHWADKDCTVCNHGDSGFSVAGYAGSEIGLLVYPQYGKCNSQLPSGQQQKSQAQNTYKSKDAAAGAAGRDMRKRENGYKWEYGARIHKDGKKYSYGPVVTDKNPKGVDLPALQKNDVGDIHTHNNGVDPQPNIMGQSDQQETVRDKDTVQKMNGGAKVDYSSYVLAPNGDLIKFTPDTSGPAGWGEPQVIKHDVAPDPNPQQ
jgi:RHS repeat-associated protein